MANKKKMIPCRVCGKMFEPCAYCQEHSDVFRWRNFACSKECAEKYINNTIAYRESLKNKKDEKEKNTSIDSTYDKNIKKKLKKQSANAVESVIESQIENEETK